MELPQDVVALMDAALARSKILIEKHFGQGELTADEVVAAAHMAVALFAAVAMAPPRDEPHRH